MFDTKIIEVAGLWQSREVGIREMLTVDTLQNVKDFVLTCILTGLTICKAFLYVGRVFERNMKRVTDSKSFTSFAFFRKSEDLRLRISEHYDIPQTFWMPACLKANGFFGCQDLCGIGGEIEGHGITPLI